jgi:HSP20 family molecular chaperone IbpA
MFKKKCFSCEKKIERDFSYCPWCGHSFNKVNDNEWGMLGKNDESQQIENQMKLPFGFNGIINTLMKQIEKDLSGMDNGSPMPKGFKIQISKGPPRMQNINEPQKTMVEPVEIVSEDERQRRSKLKRVDAKSAIRRLPEGVIYEIDAPGVKTKNDVTITKLEQSLEVKAYSEDKCYVKTFPMKVEILGIVVKADKIFLKLKG